jgi:transposase
MPCRPAAALRISPEDRHELLQLLALRTVPQGVVLRARIVLGAADGTGNKVLARQLATSLPTVLLWRGRYRDEGLVGILEERPRSGRPREITPEQEAALIERTLHTTPANATHWSVPLRANIDETGLLVVITEQGENRNQCEEQRNLFGFPHGFARRGT